MNPITSAGHAKIAEECLKNFNLFNLTAKENDNITGTRRTGKPIGSLR